MILEKNGNRLRWILLIVVLIFLANAAQAGEPYGSKRYMPQRRFHGYYPTMWRAWPTGWQAPIHMKHMPTLRPTPTTVPADQKPSEAEGSDAAPAPPSGGELPLEPLDQPRPDTDEAPALPTPPGLEDMLPEPSVPGSAPVPPGLEEPMPSPSTPDSTPPLSEPGPTTLDEPLEMPRESTPDTPPEVEEPGLTPRDLEKMPDPNLPPGFETPEMEDQPSPESTPEEAPKEPDSSDKSSSLPSSGWTGRVTNAISGSARTNRRPLYNRLRETTPSHSANHAGRGQAEPRRLSSISIEAQPLPQRLPPPRNQVARPATQAKFNVPAANDSDVDVVDRDNQRVAVLEAGNSRHYNPLRARQPSAPKVVRRHNPLR